jgi:DNA-binding SARP family transcriptional activator
MQADGWAALMRFNILGPIEVRVAGQLRRLGGHQQRLLLVYLLLHANRAVSFDQLIEVLWAGVPPRSAKARVQTAVHDLRRVLGDHLRSVPSGYLLQLPPGGLDLHDFADLAERGRLALAEGQPEHAATLLRSALALWRGPALGDVADDLRSDADALEERRLSAVEHRIDAELRDTCASGTRADLVQELNELVRAYPLREGLYELLMRALAAAGRRAEALAAYRDAHRRLADELGIDPSDALQGLHRELLDGGAPLTQPEHGPCQLPPDLPDFVGRDKELARLLGYLVRERGDDDHAPAIVGITGPAGVGKTALAVRAAHRLRGHFPDGQLFVNLADATGVPLDPADALAGFLRALGASGATIPAGLAERSATLRQRLADRRVLLVLDNTSSEAQVRPLLPGGARCAVLVTSRGHLFGLAGVQPLPLDVMPAEQAIELLGRIVGPERVDAKRESAERIAGYCDHLPLAVRIAGARLAGRVHWPLARLADRLAAERSRLDELTSGDQAVRASIELSYRALADGPRRLLRRICLLRPSRICAWTAAALLETDLTTAEARLDELVDAQLAQPVLGSASFGMHDLVRLYGRERAEAEDPGEERRDAVRRALSGWLALAEYADRGLPGGTPSPATGSPGWLPADFTAEALVGVPLSWFDAEFANLVDAVEQAADEGHEELAWRLCSALGAYCELRSYLDELGRAAMAALRAARAAGDRRGEAHAWRLLGDRYLLDPRYPDAIDCYLRCLPVLREFGEPRAEARVLSGLGEAEMYSSQLEQARVHLDAAEALVVDCGDDRALAYVARAQAWVARRRGDNDRAIPRMHEAVELYRRSGDRQGEELMLIDLGEVLRAEGRLEEAYRCLRDAEEMAEAIGDRRNVAFAAKALGRLHQLAGRHEQAYASLTRAMQLFHRLGDEVGTAHAQESLGELYAAQGRLAEAEAAYRAAYPVFRDRGIPLWQGRTLARLADVLAAAGRHQDALVHRREAVEILTPIAPAEAASDGDALS